MRCAVRSLFAGLTLGVTPFATPIAAQTPREALRLAPPWTRNAVMYEVNVRQYTPEGTFAALRPHLPRLRQLGVDVLWLMPVIMDGMKNMFISGTISAMRRECLARR